MGGTRSRGAPWPCFRAARCRQNGGSVTTALSRNPGRRSWPNTCRRTTRAGSAGAAAAAAAGARRCLCLSPLISARSSATRFLRVPCCRLKFDVFPWVSLVSAASCSISLCLPRVHTHIHTHTARARTHTHAGGRAATDQRTGWEAEGRTDQHTPAWRAVEQGLAKVDVPHRQGGSAAWATGCCARRPRKSACLSGAGRRIDVHACQLAAPPAAQNLVQGDEAQDHHGGPERHPSAHAHVWCGAPCRVRQSERSVWVAV